MEGTPQQKRKLTLDQWLLKSELTARQLAQKAEVDYRVITLWREKPMKPVQAMKIIRALRDWFDRFPELLKNVDAPLPEYPQDFDELEVFDPAKHRAPRGSKKQHQEQEKTL